MAEDSVTSGQEKVLASEKASPEGAHLEETVTREENLVYDADEEPELHARTYLALAAMFLLNLVQVFALQGPPAVVSPLATNRLDIY